MGDLVTTQRDGQGHYLPGHTTPGPGRPTLYSDAVVEVIHNNLRQGVTPRYAALAAGITEETYYVWQREYPAFSESCARAKAEWFVLLTSSVTRAVVGDPTYKGDPKTALRALELRDKRDWGPSIDVKHVPDDAILRLLRANQQDAITEDGRPAIVSGAEDI